MTDILNEISPLWGVCPFDSISDSLIECRAKSRLPSQSHSVIIMAFPYLLPDEYYEGSNISKYAVSADYHGIVMSRLESAAEKLREMYPNEEFVCFSDNSPIPEVKTAVMAGIGVLGNNSLLITEKYGSFVFIGEIVTSLKLEATASLKKNCIGCGKCVEACPGRAITENGIKKIDCLSDITQRKGELSRAQIDMIKQGGCFWGCDICQNVCPMNKNISTTDIDEFISSAIGKITTDTPIEGRAYAWRGKAVIERNLNFEKEKS